MPDPSRTASRRFDSTQGGALVLGEGAKELPRFGPPSACCGPKRRAHRGGPPGAHEDHARSPVDAPEEGAENPCKSRRTGPKLHPAHPRRLKGPLAAGALAAREVARDPDEALVILGGQVRLNRQARSSALRASPPGRSPACSPGLAAPSPRASSPWRVP